MKNRILVEKSVQLIAPPEADEFNANKSKLITSFTDSQERKSKTLVQEIE